jgi:hypothetical protein
VLGALNKQVSASRKYVVVARLDDNGSKADVLEIYIDCTQRDDVIAVATAYGKGGCLSENKCASMIDGSTIRSTLCYRGTIGECGKILSASFEEYASRQRKSPQ